jgi:hypothetical protein
LSQGRNVFAVARSIWDDGDFAPEPFTEREAWMWLVSAAAWKDIRARGNAGAVDLKRGEFSFATRFLAEKWKWSKSRVDRFIQRIENRGSIRDTSRDNAKIYLVSKYNEYQVVGLPKRDSERDTQRDDSGTRAGQQRDKEETGKQDNRETVEPEARSARADAPVPKPVSREASTQPDLLDIPAFLKRPQPAPASQPVEKTITPPSGEVVPFVPAPAREIDAAVQAYNLTADYAKWPRCQVVTDKRRRALKARLDEAGGLEGWKTAMRQAAKSSFLLGRTGRSGDHAKWRPDIDFFLAQSKFTKLMEGGYDDPAGQQFQQKPQSAHDKFNAGAAAFIASLSDDDEQGGQGEADGALDGPGIALLAP